MYQINDIPINMPLQVQYLGVYFSRDLSWCFHIEYMTTKANRMLGFLKRNSPWEVKNAPYLTNIRPILEYASGVWYPHQQYLIKKT